jgi:hypothetical protein
VASTDLGGVRLREGLAKQNNRASFGWRHRDSGRVAKTSELHASSGCRVELSFAMPGGDETVLLNGRTRYSALAGRGLRVGVEFSAEESSADQVTVLDRLEAQIARWTPVAD